MLVENIKINIDGMEMEVGKGTTLLEISKMFNKKDRKPVIAKVNDTISELNIVANDNDNIEFLDVTDPTGNRVYVSGLILLLNYAFNEIYHGKNVITVKHSVDKALCIETSAKITKTELAKYICMNEGYLDLFFDNKKLEDDKTFSDYNIKNESTFYFRFNEKISHTYQLFVLLY